MDHTTHPTVRPLADRRSPRGARVWICALLAAIVLATGMLTPSMADAASGRPQVGTGTYRGEPASHCYSNGACTTSGGGTVPMLAVNGWNFSPYAIVSVQVINIMTNRATNLSASADRYGNFWLGTDIQVCRGPYAPRSVQAYAWISKRWSNAATFVVC